MNSDSTLLRMQVDVGKAFVLLNMFKEAGKNRIDIQTILDEVAPKIVGYKKYLEKLADGLSGRDGCHDQQRHQESGVGGSTRRKARLEEQPRQLHDLF